MMAGLVLVGAVGAEEEGAEVSLTLDVASAYVFRGVTLNAEPVVQPGLEVSGLPIPLTLGVWGNLDIGDDGGALAAGEISEIDLYGSYALPVEGLDVSLGYTEYTYPGGADDPMVSTNEDSSVSADAVSVPADREVTLGLGLDVPAAPSLAVSYGLGGGIAGDLYVELGLGHGIEISDDLGLDLSGGVAYLASGDVAGFSHYTAGASVGYKALSAGVTYIGRIDDSVLDDEAYRTQVVGTVGVGYSF